MTRLRLDLVTDDAGLLAVRDAWDALIDRTGNRNLFLTWEWAFEWRRHLAPDARLHVVLVRAADELVAVAPFVVMPRNVARFQWLPALQLMGSGDVGADYLDLIVRPGYEAESADLVASHLAQQPFMVDARRLATGSIVEAMTGSLATRGWSSATRSFEVCPFIRLAGHTWDSYLATLGSQHRYNFKRRLRQLQETHELRFDRVTTEADRGPALETLFRLHGERWGERSTAFYSPALRQFHHSVTARALARGWLRLFVLTVDGNAAAALYGFAFGRKFYFYQAGFDPAWRASSVGLVCQGLAIRSACDEGLDEYDLLHGDESYKFLWAKESRPLVQYELYPPAVTAAVCRTAANSYRGARRAARHLLTAARSVLHLNPKIDRARQPVALTSAR